jgi:rhodanese-related sulfurtransferase
VKNAHDLVTAARSRIREISPQQADQSIVEANALLDVREPDEFAAGHIPGAIHIARGLLEFKLSSSAELDSRDKKIVLYCKSGGRAALAACTLLEMGYLHVASIAGGLDAWAAAGKPVVKPDSQNFE